MDTLTVSRLTELQTIVRCMRDGAKAEHDAALCSTEPLMRPAKASRLAGQVEAFNLVLSALAELKATD